MSINSLNSYLFSLIETTLNRPDSGFPDTSDFLEEFNRILKLNHSNTLLLTAKSGIQAQLHLTDQMQDLATEASDPTISISRRDQLNFQIRDLLEKFQTITHSTNFQGANLLDGNLKFKGFPLLQASDLYLKTFDGPDFGSPTPFVASPSAEKPISVDLRGNGKVDLVTADPDDGTISVFLARGDGTFEPRATYVTHKGVTSVQAVDTNSDGITDLLALNPKENTVSVLLGRGDGTFEDGTEFSVESSSTAMKAADLNGDEKADLIVTNASNNQAVVFFQTDDGTFKKAQELSTGTNPQSILIQDLNGDDHADFLTLNKDDGNISVFLNDGLGNFTEGEKIVLELGVTEVIAGDLKNSGKIDLIALNPTNSTYTILESNGDGTFKDPVKVQAPFSPNSASLFDLNSDGKLDLVFASSTYNKLYSLEGNGNATFSTSPQTLQYSPAAKGVDFVDLDGDGKKDLLSMSGNSSRTINVALSHEGGRQGVDHINVLTAENAEKLSLLLSKTRTMLEKESLKVNQLSLDVSREARAHYLFGSISLSQKASLMEMAETNLNALILTSLLANRK